MQTPRFLIAPILLSWMAAVPVLSDFAPLRIGNTWTYRGSVSTDTYGPSGALSFQEYLEVRVVRQDGEPGEGKEVLWTIELRDSLFNRERRDPRTGQPAALADTILVLRQVLKEAGDSIALVPGDPPGLTGPFLTPALFFGLHANLFFHSRQVPPGSTPVAGANGGHTVIEVSPYGVAYSSNWYPGSKWLVEGVGLFWTEWNGWGENCVLTKRVLVLDAFNGEPVDIGIPTPSSPLAKEAKIACTTIRLKGKDAPILRLGEARRFNLLGRRLPDMAGR